MAERQPDTNPFHKVGQLLALLDENEGALALSLFESGELDLSGVVQALGQERAFQFVNRLGWAELASVGETTLKATRLGRTVADVISKHENQR